MTILLHLCLGQIDHFCYLNGSDPSHGMVFNRFIKRFLIRWLVWQFQTQQMPMPQGFSEPFHDEVSEVP